MDHDNPVDFAPRETGGVGDRVAGSVTLLFLTNMLMRVMQLATTAILARLLTPADYGLVALATTIAGFIDLISNLQIGGAIMRMQDITTEHLGSAFTVNLIRSLLTAVVLALLAQPLAIYMDDIRLAGVLYALVPSLVIAGLNNPYLLLFARNIDYRKQVTRGAIAVIGGSLAGIVTAIAMPSYWALIVGSLCTNLIAMVLSYWRVPGLPRLSLKKSAAFFSYGSWLILINIIEYINGKIDYVLIGKGLGSRSLGAYHVGQQVTVMATGDIVSPLSQALMPAFSIMSTDPERLKAGYRQVQSLTLALALPIGFGISLLAKDTIYLLVGRQWELAIPVIHFLAPIIALQTMVASIDSLALATGNAPRLVLRSFIFLCVRAILMFVGYYTGGFIGVIYARMLSGSFFLLYGLWFAARITNSQWYDPILVSWRSFLSVSVMWIALYSGPGFLPWGDLDHDPIYTLFFLLAAKILFGAALYVGTHFLTWKMAGFPDGSEQKLLEQIRRITYKLSTRYKVARTT